MSKKVIMNVLSSSGLAGAESVVLTIMRHMCEEYDFIYVSLDGSIREVVEGESFIFESVESMSVKAVGEKVSKYKPDVVHAHDFRASVICARLKMDVKIISHLHCNPTWLSKINVYSIVYALCAKRFYKILLVSKSIVDEYIFAGAIAKKCQVIGNPVDIGRVNGMVGEKTVVKDIDVLFLGRLESPKNPIGFIDIVKLLKERNQAVKCAMVGDGSLKEECEKIIDKYGLCDNICMYGFLDNPYKVLKSSKVLCAPSVYEGFGLAVAEALCIGVPVVASNVGGLKDLVTEECGLCCKNEKEFVDEIDMLLMDPVYFLGKSSKAYDRGMEIANLEGYLEMIKRGYEE